MPYEVRSPYQLEVRRRRTAILRTPLLSFRRVQPAIPWTVSTVRRTPMTMMATSIVRTTTATAMSTALGRRRAVFAGGCGWSSMPWDCPPPRCSHNLHLPTASGGLNFLARPPGLGNAAVASTVVSSWQPCPHLGVGCTSRTSGDRPQVTAKSPHFGDDADRRVDCDRLLGRKQSASKHVGLRPSGRPEGQTGKR